MKTTLQAIFEKYSALSHNQDNYSIGGGRDDVKFASRRHEDATNDAGKLTLGQANQLFAKATGLTVDQVRKVIEYAVPNMEWHHAGKLPKNYGGGMKKTYFLNSAEICRVASGFSGYLEKAKLSKTEAEKKATEQRWREQRMFDFLQKNARKVDRVRTRPAFFYQTAQEMEGKYGWFDSTYKSYKLPEYYSGWAFESAEKMQEFYQIK